MLPRSCRALRFTFFTLLGALLSGQVASGSIESIGHTSTNSGRIILPQFDSSLGVLSHASVNVSWDGQTGASSGGPSSFHSHLYSVNAGPFAITGNTLGSQGTILHSHRVLGSTSRTFSGSSASIFDNGQTIALPAASTALANGHNHSLTTSSWAITTNTTFHYYPFSDLASVTLNSGTSFGSVSIPAFDSSLGTLLQADVRLNWYGTTEVANSGWNSHAHSYNLGGVGPFHVSGITFGFGGQHQHSLSSFDDVSFRGNDLSAFNDMQSFATPSGYHYTSYNDHSHRYNADDIRYSTTTTFWYLPDEANSAVPEPFSILVWMTLGCVAVSGSQLVRCLRRQSTML